MDSVNRSESARFRAIAQVRAIRRFTEVPLPDADVLGIVNAGRRAQSAKNTQPCRFIVVRERGLLVALSEVGPYARHLAGAAAGVFIVTPPRDEFTVLLDTGQATAYMQLEAWERGIGSCIGAIRNAPAARELLGYPEPLECWISVSFGYPAEEQSPLRAGGRLPLDDVMFHERWGESG